MTADLQSRGILTQAMSANMVFSTDFTALNAEAVDNPASITSLTTSAAAAPSRRALPLPALIGPSTYP
ncbi:MAG: hypothetical protein MO852_11045, partial [Candidatus Devosia euplotis]|nr:hypothetical protein [Candidatus Devosia euplotis]